MFIKTIIFFKPLVLTPGYSLTPQEARSLQSSFKAKSEEEEEEEESTRTKNDETRLVRIFFKARILGPNSPHSFLPNSVRYGCY